MNQEKLDHLVADVAMLKEVFAGAIAAHAQRQAALARQYKIDRERANMDGERTAANRLKLAQDAERAKKFAKPQSRVGILDNPNVR